MNYLRKYTLSHKLKLIAHVSLWNFCLQSCSDGLDHNIVANKYKEALVVVNQTNQKLESNKQRLVDKQYIAQRGELVNFYKQGEELLADIKESYPPLTREAQRFEVYIVDDQRIPTLEEGKENRCIEIDNKLRRVYVGGRVRGGMKRESKKGKEEIDKKGKEKEKREEKEEETEKRANVVQTNDFDDLLNVASQGDPEALFRVGKKLCEDWKSQNTEDMGCLSEGLSWLYQAALMHYQPAIDLLAIFGIEVGQGAFLRPFSNLYPLENNQGAVPIEDFKAYCTKLFKNINSFEAYQRTTLITYINDLMYWINDIRENLTSSDISLEYDYEHDRYIIDVATILSGYIENILRSDYFENFPLEGKLELLDKYYLLIHHVATVKLYVVACTADRKLVQQYVKGYRETKGKLKNRFGLRKELLKVNYIEKLNDIYEMILVAYPHVANYFDSQPQKKVLFRNNKKPCQLQGKYLLEKQRENLQKIRKNMEVSTPLMHFATKQVEFKELLQNKNQHHISEETIKKWREKFLELEQLAFSMCPTINSNRCDFTKLTIDNLIAIYRSMLESDIDIYEFMRNGVMLSNMANNFEEGLIRLKVMEAFYNLEKRPVGLETYLAIAYAGYGQYDRLAKLYEELIRVELVRLKEERIKWQKKIEQIKKAQKLAQSSVKPLESGYVVIKEQKLDTGVTADIENISEATYKEKQLRRKEEAKERLQRHKEAEEERKQKSLPEKEEVGPINEEKEEPSTGPQAEEVHPTGSSTSETAPIIIPLLGSKAYETLSKIFTNEWKISRKDIENLFNELGHTINTATKSSHHIVNIPSGITLVNQDGQIMGMISNLAAQVGGHLSLPSWEDIVPIYMRNQIKNLLSAIGINEDNYSKGSSEERTQFVPTQGSSEAPQNLTPQTNTVKKKRKRRKKKNPS